MRYLAAILLLISSAFAADTCVILKRASNAVHIWQGTSSEGEGELTCLQPQPLGVRLRQHTLDRLNGRWGRFSWVGVYPVAETGALDTDAIGAYDLTMLIVTMEALLIEGLEPP